MIITKNSKKVPCDECYGTGRIYHWGVRPYSLFWFVFLVFEPVPYNCFNCGGRGWFYEENSK